MPFRDDDVLDILTDILCCNAVFVAICICDHHAFRMDSETLCNASLLENIEESSR